MSGEYKFPFEAMVKQPGKEKRTPLIYRGGKTSLASWVIEHFPSHKYYVDVFGGGGGVLFAKGPSEVDVYNDVGDVACFMYVLRTFGDELYRRLYFTPWSREEFYTCHTILEDIENPAQLDEEDMIEWARCWFVQINQAYTHGQDDPTWLVSKYTNIASSYASHVDDLPRIIQRLRNVIIEKKDFMDILTMYDSESTLFYCDPPYFPETWENNAYRNEMSVKSHEDLLYWLNTALQGQAVVSGYDNQLYARHLSAFKGWKKYQKTRPLGLKNTSHKNAVRTECLWVKEHRDAIWSYQREAQYTSSFMAGVSSEETHVEGTSSMGRE